MAPSRQTKTAFVVQYGAPRSNYGRNNEARGPALYPSFRWTVSRRGTSSKKQGLRLEQYPKRLSFIIVHDKARQVAYPVVGRYRGRATAHGKRAATGKEPRNFC